MISNVKDLESKKPDKTSLEGPIDKQMSKSLANTNSDRRETTSNSSRVDSDTAEQRPLKEINYESLNGLRGVGALCVYFQHFMFEFFPSKFIASDFKIKTTIPTWFKNFQLSPLCVFWYGEFWVIVFFILSGFVLPLKFYKTKRP